MEGLERFQGLLFSMAITILLGAAVASTVIQQKTCSLGLAGFMTSKCVLYPISEPAPSSHRGASLKQEVSDCSPGAGQGMDQYGPGMPVRIHSSQSNTSVSPSSGCLHLDQMLCWVQASSVPSKCTLSQETSAFTLVGRCCRARRLKASTWHVLEQMVVYLWKTRQNPMQLKLASSTLLLGVSQHVYILHQQNLHFISLL